MTTPRKRAPRTRKPAAPSPPPVQDDHHNEHHDGHPSMDIEPAYDLAQYHDSDDLRPATKPIALMGCLIVMMNAAMLAIIVFLIYDRSNDSTPDVAPPSPNNLAPFVAPIAAKLATDPAKAATVADAYTGLTAAIAGKTGQRLTSSRIFETAHAAFLTDLDAMGGVAVGEEIDQAIGSYLGMTKATGDDPGWEPIAFDASHRVKLVEITAAIAKAAEVTR